MDQTTQCESNQTSIPITSTMTNKWVRYILGFSLSVALGLAPYLGKLKVPFFHSLLELIPVSMQNELLPLSAALMGIVAIFTQWYGNEKLSVRWLKKYFIRTLLLSIFVFVILITMHTLVVVEVPIYDGSENMGFVVGFTRPMQPPCPIEVSDAECIKRLTFSPNRIASFWGDRQIRLATLALTFSYLCFTSCFGMLVGIIVLQEIYLGGKSKRTKNKSYSTPQKLDH